MLTFLPLEQIDEMDKWEGSQLNRAKEILAYELTALVHGEEEAKKAENAAKALFGAGGDSANMPTTVLADADFENGGINILSLLVATGLCPRRGPPPRSAGRHRCGREEGREHRREHPAREVLRRGRYHPQGQKGLPQGRDQVSTMHESLRSAVCGGFFAAAPQGLAF